MWQMERKSGGEWIHAYVWRCPFTIQKKLSHHCLSAISKYNIKSSKNEKKIVCEEVARGRDIVGERP